MIDFELSENHRHVEELVADFGPKHILPNLRENDRAQRLDPQLLPRMAEACPLCIWIPTTYGRAGLDYISLGLACEGMGYFDTAARVVLSVHVGLMSCTLLAYGTEEQKQKYLVELAKGKRIGTFGLT